MLVHEDERPLGAAGNQVSSAALTRTAQPWITTAAARAMGTTGGADSRDGRLFTHISRLSKRTVGREETFEGHFLS